MKISWRGGDERSDAFRGPLVAAHRGGNDDLPDCGGPPIGGCLVSGIAMAPLMSDDVPFEGDGSSLESDVCGVLMNAGPFL